MKLVRESIASPMSFQRGKDLKQALRIGEHEIIDRWFKTWAPNVKYTVDEDYNIKVSEYLDLDNTEVTELPDNLSIVGYLDLENTQIKELPDNFSVGGSLYLSNTPIKELPDNLSVGWDIYTNNPNLKSSNPEIQKKITYI